MESQEHKKSLTLLLLLGHKVSRGTWSGNLWNKVKGCGVKLEKQEGWRKKVVMLIRRISLFICLGRPIEWADSDNADARSNEGVPVLVACLATPYYSHSFEAQGTLPHKPIYSSDAMLYRTRRYSYLNWWWRNKVADEVDGWPPLRWRIMPSLDRVRQRSWSCGAFFAWKRL